ncbi:MAG: hypothetical protein ACI4A3_07775 [Lachnospiraceae bacterium]
MEEVKKEILISDYSKKSIVMVCGKIYKTLRKISDSKGCDAEEEIDGLIDYIQMMDIAIPEFVLNEILNMVSIMKLYMTNKQQCAKELVEISASLKKEERNYNLEDVNLEYELCLQIYSLMCAEIKPYIVEEQERHNARIQYL